jgi:hypothetical protein
VSRHDSIRLNGRHLTSAHLITLLICFYELCEFHFITPHPISSDHISPHLIKTFNLPSHQSGHPLDFGHSLFDILNLIQDLFEIEKTKFGIVYGNTIDMRSTLDPKPAGGSVPLKGEHPILLAIASITTASRKDCPITRQPKARSWKSMIANIVQTTIKTSKNIRGTWRRKFYAFPLKWGHNALLIQKMTTTSPLPSPSMLSIVSLLLHLIILQWVLTEPRVMCVSHLMGMLFRVALIESKKSSMNLTSLETIRQSASSQSLNDVKVWWVYTDMVWWSHSCCEYRNLVVQ